MAANRASRASGNPHRQRRPRRGTVRSEGWSTSRPSRSAPSVGAGAATDDASAAEVSGRVVTGPSGAGAAGPSVEVGAVTTGTTGDVEGRAGGAAGSWAAFTIEPAIGHDGDDPRGHQVVEG